VGTLAKEDGIINLDSEFLFGHLLELFL